jgi:hypothetical protein
MGKEINAVDTTALMAYTGENEYKIRYKVSGEQTVADKLQEIMGRFIESKIEGLLPFHLNINIVAARHDTLVTDNLGIKDIILKNKKFKYNLIKLPLNNAYSATLAVTSEYFLHTNKLDLETFLVLTLSDALGEIFKSMYIKEYNISMETIMYTGFSMYLSTRISAMYSRDLAEKIVILSSMDGIRLSLCTITIRSPIVMMLSAKIALINKTKYPPNMETNIIYLLTTYVEEDLRYIYSSILSARKLDKARYSDYLIKMRIIEKFKDDEVDKGEHK